MLSTLYLNSIFLFVATIIFQKAILTYKKYVDSLKYQVYNDTRYYYILCKKISF